MSAWASVLVGVADIDQAAALWVGQFGFVARDHPPETGAGERSLLLSCPSADCGALHLVQYRQPGPAVRAGAQVFDHCPKNLDVYVDDLPRRMRELQAAGYHFHRDQYSEVTAPNGVRFREVHMAGHDHINIVLLELIDQPMAFTAQGYYGVAALVTTVADVDAEQAFYQQQLGLQLIASHHLAGPEIETMVGLPAGAALDIRILGEPGQPLGQVEIVAYQGVTGNDLYPRARPPACGVLAARFPTAGNALTPAGLRILAGRSS